MKFLINKKTINTIPNVKIYNLGSVTTTINDLLNESTINIEQNIIPILKIDDVNYLIDNWNPNNYKEDFEILLNDTNIISLSASSGNSDSDVQTFKAVVSARGDNGNIDSITVFKNDMGLTTPFFSKLGTGIWQLNFSNTSTVFTGQFSSLPSLASNTNGNKIVKVTKSGNNFYIFCYSLVDGSLTDLTTNDKYQICFEQFI